MNELTKTFKNFPILASFMEGIVNAWPDHERFLLKGVATFQADVLQELERVAGLAKKIIGNDFSVYAADYRWMCERFQEEQLYFHRNKEYRLKTIEEAKAEVYDNHDYMSRYVRGILLSQFFWPNHAFAFYCYSTEFLAKHPKAYTHVDIGSGHGLFLALAAVDKLHGALEAWDISETSLQVTRQSLKTMGISENIGVREQDVLEDSGIRDRFDSVVCSEVLEHTEDPARGLENIYNILKPGGRAYINVPVNSPAPDHLFLWRSTDEVRDLVQKKGFSIEAFHELPGAGISLERAKKLGFDISCVCILKK